jgi:hypothetical protein
MKGENRTLRISGLPKPIKPWVAQLFSEVTKTKITYSEYLDLLEDSDLGWGGDEVDEIWHALVSYSGESQQVISLRKLTTNLARGVHHPAFFANDFGVDGPVIGTIHASKGREADDVYLFLPKAKVNTDEKDDEEASVYFVGATRAKEKLYVHEETYVHSSRLKDGGRTWRWKVPSIQFELGREGDVFAEGLVGKAYFRRVDDARLAQAWTASLSDAVYSVDIRQHHSMVREPAYVYRVLGNCDDEKSVICSLSQNLNWDLFKIRDKARKLRGRQGGPLPTRINEATVLGIRTIALAPDDPARLLLHSPWKESGLVLAPQLACLAEAIL